MGFGARIQRLSYYDFIGSLLWGSGALAVKIGDCPCGNEADNTRAVGETKRPQGSACVWV